MSFYFFSVDFDAVIDVCFDEVYAGERIVSAVTESHRRKRAFDEKVESEARRQADVENIVNLFVSKTKFWNEKIFDELLASRIEANATRNELFVALREAQSQLVANQQTLIFLVNETQEARLEFEFKFVHFGMFWRDYWDNTTTMGDKTFSWWSYHQSPLATATYFGGVLMTILLKIPDALLGHLIARKNGFELTDCQRVICYIYFCLHFLLFTFNLPTKFDFK